MIRTQWTYGTHRGSFACDTLNEVYDTLHADALDIPYGEDAQGAAVGVRDLRWDIQMNVLSELRLSGRWTGKSGELTVTVTVL